MPYKEGLLKMKPVMKSLHAIVLGTFLFSTIPAFAADTQASAPAMNMGATTPAKSKTEAHKAIHKKIVKKTRKPIHKMAHKKFVKKAHKKINKTTHKKFVKKAHKPIHKMAHKKIVKKVEKKATKKTAP
ncbi:MAG: hypothetical protein KGQ58_05975 [Proteobacteria bacterium]|nr:hypothetical protein [Pseudomonadota bacterium]